MFVVMSTLEISTVALPTEGVDRNKVRHDGSAKTVVVALPTEGVDRNRNMKAMAQLRDGRPPHGGRG